MSNIFNKVLPNVHAHAIQGRVVSLTPVSNGVMANVVVESPVTIREIKGDTVTEKRGTNNAWFAMFMDQATADALVQKGLGPQAMINGEFVPQARRNVNLDTGSVSTNYTVNIEDADELTVVSPSRNPGISTKANGSSKTAGTAGLEAPAMTEESEGACENEDIPF